MNPKPDILIHAGGHKTGSSSIQKALFTVRDALTTTDGGKLLYPDAGLRFNNHILLAYEFIPGFEDPEASPLAQLRQEIVDKGPAKVVLSAEAFENAPPQVLSAAFTRSFGPRCTTGAVVYLRSPASLVLSRYDQQMTKSWHAPTLQEIATRNGPSRGRLRWIDGWEDAFPDTLHLRPFSRAQMLNGDVVQDFFDFLVGREHPAAIAAKEIPSANVGRSAALLLLLEEAKPMVLARLPDLLAGPKLASDAALNMLRRQLQRRIGQVPSKMRWSRAALERFVQHELRFAQRLDRRCFGAPILSDEMLALLERTPVGASFPTPEEELGKSRAEIDRIIEDAVAFAVDFVTSGKSALGREKRRALHLQSRARTDAVPAGEVGKTDAGGNRQA